MLGASALTPVVPRVFLARGVGAAAGFGYGLLLANLLAPTAMGVFAGAVSAAIILATASKCGLDAYLMRHAAQRPGAAHCLAARCTVIAGLTGACLWFASLPVGFELRPAAGWTLGILNLAVPFLAMTYVLAGLLKARDAPAVAVFLETGGWQTVMCVCAVLMRFAGSDSLQVVALAFAGAGVLCFVAAAAATGLFGAGQLCRRFPARPRIRLFEAAPLAALSVAHVVMRWSDLLWLAWWLDASAVAAYAVCTRLAGGIAVVDHAVNAVAAPRFARHHGSGETRLPNVELRRAVAVSGVCGAVGATAMALVAPVVLGHLGEPYSESVGVLRVAAALAAMHVSLTPVGHLAAMSGRAVDHLKATAALLALQQLVYLLLIPRFGMAAALLGFALPQALANLLTLVVLRRREALSMGDRRAAGPPRNS